MSWEGLNMRENNATLLSGAASFPRKLPEHLWVGNSPMQICVVGTGSCVASCVCVCASLCKNKCIVCICEMMCVSTGDLIQIRTEGWRQTSDLFWMNNLIVWASVKGYVTSTVRKHLCFFSCYKNISTGAHLYSSLLCSCRFLQLWDQFTFNKSAVVSTVGS